jgi:hypothetical protein
MKIIPVPGICEVVLILLVLVDWYSGQAGHKKQLNSQN